MVSQVTEGKDLQAKMSKMQIRMKFLKMPMLLHKQQQVHLLKRVKYMNKIDKMVKEKFQN